MHLHFTLCNIPRSNHVGGKKKKRLSVLYFNNLQPLTPCPPPPLSLKFALTPGMQLCVTKPVLLESECSMRQGHMGFLPTSSLPSSPSRGCTLPLPATQGHRTEKKERGLCCRKGLAVRGGCRGPWRERANVAVKDKLVFSGTRGSID